jgi:hypothetical protein
MSSSTTHSGESTCTSCSRNLYKGTGRSDCAKNCVQVIKQERNVMSKVVKKKNRLVEDLKAAKKLLEPKGRWVVGSEVTIKGHEEDFDENELMAFLRVVTVPPEACFCTSGAIRYVTGDDSNRYDAAIKAFASVLPGSYLEKQENDPESVVVKWNDEKATHKKVLDKFDEAIKAVA